MAHFNALYVILVVLSIALLLIGLRYLCLKYFNGDFDVMFEEALYDQHDRGNQKQATIALENKHLLILTNVIHKKAVRRASHENLEFSHESVNSVEPKILGTGEESDHLGALDKHGGSEHLDVVKENILIESSKLGSTISTIYSPQTCAICMERYQENDEICWSKNKKCHHAFHLECLLQWLIKGEDDYPCPMCRENFLNKAEEDEEVGQNNGFHECPDEDEV